MRILSIVLLSFIGFGCSSMSLDKPTASIKGMSIADVNTTGFTMNFDVSVANPNTVELPLSNADYKIALGGVKVVDGKAKSSGVIPAKGSHSVAVPVTLTYENLLAAKSAIVKSGGNIEYALDGGLSVDTGAPFLGSLRVPLTYSGTLPLRDILKDPMIVLKSPAAQKIAKEIFGSIFSR